LYYNELTDYVKMQCELHDRLSASVEQVCWAALQCISLQFQIMVWCSDQYVNSCHFASVKPRAEWRNWTELTWFSFWRIDQWTSSNALH